MNRWHFELQQPLYVPNRHPKEQETLCSTGSEFLKWISRWRQYSFNPLVIPPQQSFKRIDQRRDQFLLFHLIITNLCIWGWIHIQGYSLVYHHFQLPWAFLSSQKAGSLRFTTKTGPQESGAKDSRSSRNPRKASSNPVITGPDKLGFSSSSLQCKDLVDNMYLSLPIFRMNIILTYHSFW